MGRKFAAIAVAIAVAIATDGSVRQDEMVEAGPRQGISASA